MGEKGLLGELGLVLLEDPVSGLMESHCMLQDHDFEHLLGLGMGEFVLGDKVIDVLGQCMYTFAWKLPNIRKQLVPCPKVLLGLNSCSDCIKGKPGGFSCCPLL